MATVGQDLFTEAADTELSVHTPNVGAGWTVEAGATTFTVVASTEELGKDATAHYARKGDDIGGDIMDVTADVKSSATSARRSQVAGRMTTADFNNAYKGGTQADGSLIDYALDKEIGGTITNLGTYNANDPVDTYKTVKLEIRTAAKKLFVAGVERISSADENLAGNKYAGVFMLASASASTTRLDNWLSESVAVLPPLLRRPQFLYAEEG